MGWQAKQCFSMVLIKGKAIRTSLLIFRTLVNFYAHMGLCPGAKTAPPQFCSTRTSPLLFRDKNRPFNRKVLGKPFEFKTYLLELHSLMCHRQIIRWGEYHPWLMMTMWQGVTFTTSSYILSGIRFCNTLYFQCQKSLINHTLGWISPLINDDDVTVQFFFLS